MPNSMPDDAVIRGMGRMPVIRARLTGRSWPRLTHLSPDDRDRVLDSMALQEYLSETGMSLVEHTG